VDAYRAIVFALAPEQMPEGKVRFQCVFIDLCHLDEELERLVRFSAQDEIESPNVIGADPGRQRCISIEELTESPGPDRDQDKQTGQ
jgi:hypothetical protein